MKKTILVLFILTLALLLAQQKSVITVKDSSVATGVIIVDAQMAGKAVELQCNQETPGCTNLKRGTYLMVELPKNHGIYDCKDVQVFPESANPDTDQKLGEYCLNQK